MEAEPYAVAGPATMDLEAPRAERSWSLPYPPSWRRQAVGAGLNNLGNTCFLNAVLQCLTHTVPVIEKLHSAEHFCVLSGDGDCDAFCLFCAMRSHVKRCILMSGSSISPFSFTRNLKKISPYLELGQPEDAHEFLNNLLDKLHTCCLDPNSKNQQSSSEEDTLVSQVFGGRLKSQLQCCDCGHCSDTFEPLVDISLEIEDVDSLTDALQSFTKVEKIEDPEAKFTCEGCKAEVVMEKQMKVDQAPTVITFHLKRFNNNGYYTDKIDKFLKYPLELDLSSYHSCPENEEQSKYELYAVVVHHGSVNIGHYFSIVRSSSLVWYRMDDNRVNVVTQNDALNQEAYILFYIKKGSSSSFSSFMNSQKIPYPNQSIDESPVSVLLPCPDTETSSSSSSGETPYTNKHYVPCMDASPEYVHVGPGKDHSASPRRDNSEKYITPEKEIDCAASPHRDSSPTSINVEKNTCAETPRGTGIGAGKVDAGGPPSQISMLLPDISKDENIAFSNSTVVQKENIRNPEKSLHSKDGRESVNNNLDKKDPCLNGSLGRLMRSMPSTRRSGILACLADRSEPSRKRPSTGKNNLASKRRPPLDSKDIKSESILSSNTIRGLFSDDATSEYEFSYD